MKTPFSIIDPTSETIPVLNSQNFFRSSLAIGSIGFLAAWMGYSYSAQAATLYAAEGNNINKFASDGTKTSFITTGLSSPRDLAVDLGGNLFAGDFGSGTIFKYTPSGAKTTFADGSTPFSGTSGSRLAPISLAFGTSGLGKSGNLATLDRRMAIPDFSTIENFLPSGASRSIVGAGLELYDLAVDENDNVFVSEQTLVQGGASTIRKYTPSTNSSTNFATATGGSQFSALAFDFSSPVSATAVPEPFTIVGTLIGGTAALRMRRKLNAASKM